MTYFFSVCRTNFSILFVSSFLHLQYSKRTHFHHRAFCKLMVKFDSLYSNKHKILNNSVYNHQCKTHYSAVKIKDRYMKFTDIFLCTRHINLHELKFEILIAATQWHCEQSSFYSLPAVTQVASLISNCTLSDTLPHKPLPKL
jgi:hypothetical protein